MNEYEQLNMGCCSVSMRPLQSTFQAIEEDPDGSRVVAASFFGKRRGPLKEHYVLGTQLGAGAFGLVRLGVHKLTGQTRAVKTIRKDSLAGDMHEQMKFFAEVDVLKATDHPNIVRLYEFFDDAKYYHIVTEYVEGGELFDFIVKSKVLSEHIAAGFMRQILSAVAYCHANNIVHRDIKPENLLLDKGGPNATLKVIDFGTSTIQGASALTQRYGTALYIAPEVLLKHYTEKCDLWSCGVLLYILLSGRAPFTGRNDKEILSKVHCGEYSLEGFEWDSVSASAKQLVTRLLEYVPSARISAAEALQDDWIIHNVEDLNSGLFRVTLKNLRTFRAEQKLQHTVLTFIANHLLPNNERKRVVGAFRKLDVNGDGKLSREELVQAYSKVVDSEVAGQEVENIMKFVDVNHSGYIDYTEFITASVKQEALLSKANLRTAFRVFDRDGSGKISARELKELLCGEESWNTEEMWRVLIGEVDKNGDGEIDFKEFKCMMSRVFR